MKIITVNRIILIFSALLFHYLISLEDYFFQPESLNVIYLVMIIYGMGLILAICFIVSLYKWKRTKENMWSYGVTVILFLVLVMSIAVRLQIMDARIVQDRVERLNQTNPLEVVVDYQERINGEHWSDSILIDSRIDSADRVVIDLTLDFQKVKQYLMGDQPYGVSFERRSEVVYKDIFGLVLRDHEYFWNRSSRFRSIEFNFFGPEGEQVLTSKSTSNRIMFDQQEYVLTLSTATESCLIDNDEFIFKCQNLKDMYRNEFSRILFRDRWEFRSVFMINPEDYYQLKIQDGEVLFRYKDVRGTWHEKKL